MQLTVVIQEQTPEYIHCVKRITSPIICVESKILGTNKLQVNYFLFIKEKFLAIQWRDLSSYLYITLASKSDVALYVRVGKS